LQESGDIGIKKRRKIKMTTLIEQIRADRLKARMDLTNDGIYAPLLSTLLGEAEMIGKNDGNRTTTDAEVIAIAKKFINNIDITIGVLQAQPDKHTESKMVMYKEEKRILTGYLPHQLTETELVLEITRIVGNLTDKSQKQMGLVMKELKASFDGQYDGKMASSLVKDMLK
jgi:uncharacterized protein YqeY